MPLTALITRPEEDARPLADALKSRGIATVIEPLLSIRVLPEAAPGLAQDLEGVQALLFTSANGARAFAELSPRRDIGVLAVGDATAAAARALGFSAVESAGGDVQALADLAKRRLKPENGPLFHAAGSAVAGDLPRLLGEAGFELRRRVLYESAAATALSPETVAVLKHRKIDLVLLFSPRTAAAFAGLAKAAEVDAGRLTALCLSPAVAEAVRELPWKAVEVAARPDLPSLLELVDRAGAAKPAPEPAARDPAPAPAAEPIAAPSVPPSPLPTVAPPARAGVLGLLAAGLIGALVAAVAVVAVMRFAPRQLGLAPAGSAAPAAAPGPDLQPRLADLSRRLDALQAELSSPKAAPDLGDLPARLAALQQQVSALQHGAGRAAGAAPSLPPAIEALPQRLDALTQKLDAFDRRLAAAEQKAGGDPALKAQLDDLAQEVRKDESALGEIAGLKQQLASLATSSRSETAAPALALAITALDERLSAGAPYAREIEALSRVGGSDPALREAIAAPLAALQPMAASGIPTVASLRAEFPATAEAARRADSADAAAAAGNAGLGQRVLARLESLVTIRPAGEEGAAAQGDSTPARLDRADARLAAGDLAGAVAEVSALTGPAREAARAWLQRAEARLKAESAASDLADAALAALTRTAGQP